MKIVLRIILGLVIAAFVIGAIITTLFKQSTFDLYTRRLDAWVHAGGPVERAQDEVVSNCGKLVSSQAGPIGIWSLVTFQREEFHFRVDVCVKLTVNRVHKQPEFEKPEIVRLICGGNLELYLQLCSRSGLKPQ